MSVEDVEKPENMAAFFDARAVGYDDHMRDNIFPDGAFVQFYEAMSLPIEKTGEPLHILDLGCGTGADRRALGSFESFRVARLTARPAKR